MALASKSKINTLDLVRVGTKFPRDVVLPTRMKENRGAWDSRGDDGK